MTDQNNPYTPAEEQTPATLSSKKPAGRSCGGTLLGIAYIVVPLFILLGLLLPITRRGAPEASRRMYCASNLRQIGIALLNYEAEYHSLPPAYTVDATGARLHSWRSLILPYLEQQKIYDEIDFSKPWNHPDNKSIADLTTPGTYRCPSNTIDKRFTTYLGIVDSETCFQATTGRKIADVTDGAANTLVIVEANPTDAVHWMEPTDLNLAEFLEAIRNKKSAHFGGHHTISLDNSVRYFPTDSETEFLKASVTPSANDDSGELPGA